MIQRKTCPGMESLRKLSDFIMGNLDYLEGKEVNDSCVESWGEHEWANAAEYAVPLMENIAMYYDLSDDLKWADEDLGAVVLYAYQEIGYCMREIMERTPEEFLGWMLLGHHEVFDGSGGREFVSEFVC